MSENINKEIAKNRDLDKFYELAFSYIKAWGGSKPPQFISASENMVYRTTDSPNRILRITEERHRSLNYIRAEMAFVQYLSDNDIPVIKPVASLSDKLVETSDGTYACLFEKAKGKMVGKQALYQNLDIGAKLGELLGNIHKVSNNYKPSVPWLKRYRYRDIEDITDALNILPIEEKEARMEYEKSIAWYDSLPIEKGAYGLIHMDAHGNNLFATDSGALTLIDFDDCAYNFYAYDLAVVLYYLDSQDMDKTAKLVFRKVFLDAYLKAYPLPQKWIDIIDGFIRLRIIELYIWGWKMFGRPIKDGKTVHFLDWRNNNIDISIPYPKLREKNTLYVEPLKHGSSEGIAYFNGKSYECTLGKNGIIASDMKTEGDKATPAGRFALRKVFYRPDKINSINTKLPNKVISKNDGWCDDSESDDYNSLVLLPHQGSHEKMWRDDDLYNIVVEIGYNDNPAVSGKGSAIFMHVMHPERKPTEGCVAFKITDLKEIISNCDHTTEINISH